MAGITLHHINAKGLVNQTMVVEIEKGTVQKVWLFINIFQGAHQAQADG